ncbi:MAG: hypothetical protein ACOC0U_00855 [Desulfovibrionales bacterium]
MNSKNIFLLFFLVFLLAGCGVKKWPEPQASEERFSLREVSADRRNACVRITGLVTGNFENLGRVEVLLEKVDPDLGDCPECPFSPTRTVVLQKNDPDLILDKPLIRARICELEPKSAFRLRLVATNTFPVLDLVESEILFLESEDN